MDLTKPSWKLFRLSERDAAFTIVGMGEEWEGRVYQGAMKGDCLAGLRALGTPLFAADVLHAWTIKAPQVFAEGDNKRPNRRFLEFTSPTAPGFVLRFSGDVTAQLLSDLRIAFRGPAVAQPEEDDDEGSRREKQPAPEDGRGDRPRLGHAVDRHPARKGRPRPEGLVQKAVGRPRKKLGRPKKRRT
jgi:hypothetical protein